MQKFALMVLSYILWLLLTWPFGEKGEVVARFLIMGVPIAIIVGLWFGELMKVEPGKMFNPKRYFWFLLFLPVLGYHAFLAACDVVYRVLHPRMPIRPGIVKVKINLTSPSAITALANSITLTPGTLSVDITDDGHLYVHWINVQTLDIEEATKRIVKRYETFIKRIFE